jgi:FemAB-related protein (PEP-CTERM system-associated)
MPYLDTGGILALSDQGERALLDAALALMRERRARALELRLPSPLGSLPSAAFADRVDLALPLAGDEDAQWRALPATVRNQCRKAERGGLRLIDGSSDALCAGFFDPFCVNMRDLGSPVHGERFFRAMASAFGDRLRFIVTGEGDRSAGGLVAIDYAGVVTIPWASTLRSERARCPNNQIYWEAIRWAIARGAHEVDFGRSPQDSGTYRFKRGWGAEPRALAWIRFGTSGQPESPSSAKDSRMLQRMSQLWQRLPVPWTRIVGPVIRRRISS